MRWAVIWVGIVAAILVPFVLFEDYFNSLVPQVAGNGSGSPYVVLLVVGLLAGDVFLPVPSSIVSTTAGALLGFGRGAFAVWAGMTVSCIVGYAVGAWSASAARRVVGEGGLTRAAAIAARYGHLAIALARPVPVLAEASVIFTGMVRTPFLPFLLITSASNLGVAAGYAAIGAFSMRADAFLLAFAGSLLVPALGMLAARLWMPRPRG